MTLEEAREAHKTGFPDVFNGWADMVLTNNMLLTLQIILYKNLRMTIGLKEMKQVIIGKIITMSLANSI